MKIVENKRAKGFTIPLGKYNDKTKTRPRGFVLVPGLNNVSEEVFKTISAHPFYKELVHNGALLVHKSTADAIEQELNG